MILLTILASVAAANEPTSHADQLWQGYLRHFEPQAGDEQPAGWTCGSALVADLKEHWGELDPEQQRRISEQLSPWQDSLMDDLVEPPVRPPADATCWSPDGDNVLASDHFQIEWDDAITQAQAEQLAQALETSREVMLADGWREPVLADQYLMQVFVRDGLGSGAYTTTRVCGGVDVAYMVVNNAVFRNNADYYKTVAAHEYNHTSQYAYGQAHQTWFFEATATWSEDTVFDDANDWASQIEGGYLENPQLAMHTSDRTDFDAEWHMYGMGIWLFFLDEHVGGGDLVREMWDYASRVDVPERSLWQQDTLQGLEIDFDEVYADFLVNNITMDFDEAENFGEIRHDSEDFFPNDDDVTSDGQAPQSLGASYVKFETRGWDEGANTDMMIEFSGDAELSWLVQVVTVDDGAVTEVWHVPLDAGLGYQRVEDVWTYDAVWLVASPLARDDYPTEHYPYRWEANPVLPLRGSGLGACGCASGPGTGWLPLLPLWLWVRRRQNPV